MAGNEPLRALQWVRTTLAADAAFTAACPGGIWRGVAPQGTPPPYCVLSIQSGMDLATLNGNRVWNDALILVKVVGPPGLTVGGVPLEVQMQTAADRVDALLHKVTGGYGGSVIVESVRESAPSLDEVLNDVVWSNFSGAYRIKVA